MQTRARLNTSIAVLFASATLLVGCGGSTVTSEDVEATATSVAPLERSSSPSTTEESESPSSSEESSASQPVAGGGVAAPVAPGPEDQGAREVSEIPEAQPERSPNDEAYLDLVAESEINIEGVESQLIGTAQTVCAENAGAVAAATVLGVAGQLSTQGRTELSPEEVSTILTDSAREIYCP